MLFKVSYQRAEHMFVAVYEYPHLVSSQIETFVRTSVTVASARTKTSKQSNYIDRTEFTSRYLQ